VWILPTSGWLLASCTTTDPAAPGAPPAVVVPPVQEEEENEPPGYDESEGEPEPDPSAGAVSVYSGAGLFGGAPEPWARYDGRWLYDEIGREVGGADLDGDGDVELVIGARAWWGEQQDLHGFVVHPEAGVHPIGETPGPVGCADRLSLVGDLDGDGVRDALCIPEWNATAGAVLSGASLETARFDTATARFRIPGSIFDGGDYDGDGVSELIVEDAILSDDPWVGTLGSQDARVTFAGRVLSAVDIDGDGAAEVLTWEGGRAWLYPSSALGGVGPVANTAAVPVDDVDLDGVGDWNGDGFVDVKVRARSGMADVLSGLDLMAGTRTVLAVLALDGEQCLWISAEARDLDADGRPELALSGCASDVWLFRGADLPLDGSTVGLERAVARFPIVEGQAASIAWVDDLDGDTVPELVIGDSYARTDAPKKGGVEVPCAGEENTGDPDRAPLASLYGWFGGADVVGVTYTSSDPDGDVEGVGVVRLYANGRFLFEEPAGPSDWASTEIPLDDWDLAPDAAVHVGFLLVDAAGNKSNCGSAVTWPE
jgi:hypothetical protein